MWDEYETLIPLTGCNCDKYKDFLSHLRKKKLYQFLMDLNDSYNQAISQILFMIPLPIVNQAYAMLVSDENQKSMTAANFAILGASPSLNSGNCPSINSGSYESTALYSARTSDSKKFKKNSNVQCSCCKLKGHTRKISTRL